MLHYLLCIGKLKEGLDPDLDPYPHGSALICVVRSGSRGAKMNHNREKRKECSCFDSQGFGSGSGSVLDPYSIGPLDPDPDP